jgi:hypothetical protein
MSNIKSPMIANVIATIAASLAAVSSSCERRTGTKRHHRNSVQTLHSHRACEKTAMHDNVFLIFRLIACVRFVRRYCSDASNSEANHVRVQ